MSMILFSVCLSVPPPPCVCVRFFFSVPDFVTILLKIPRSLLTHLWLLLSVALSSILPSPASFDSWHPSLLCSPVLVGEQAQDGEQGKL